MKIKIIGLPIKTLSTSSRSFRGIMEDGIRVWGDSHRRIHQSMYLKCRGHLLGIHIDIWREMLIKEGSLTSWNGRMKSRVRLSKEDTKKNASLEALSRPENMAVKLHSIPRNHS